MYEDVPKSLLGMIGLSWVLVHEWQNEVSYLHFNFHILVEGLLHHTWNVECQFIKSKFLINIAFYPEVYKSVKKVRPTLLLLIWYLNLHDKTPWHHDLIYLSNLFVNPWDPQGCFQNNLKHSCYPNSAMGSPKQIDSNNVRWDTASVRILFPFTVLIK